MNIEPDRLRDVFCWRVERLVSKQLAFSYERKRIILAENEITRARPSAHGILTTDEAYERKAEPVILAAQMDNYPS